MQIINRRLLIKAVLKGKNIFGTRPLIHTQKKKNYDCFTLIKIKNMYTVEQLSLNVIARKLNA